MPTTWASGVLWPRRGTSILTSFAWSCASLLPSYSIPTLTNGDPDDSLKAASAHPVLPRIAPDSPRRNPSRPSTPTQTNMQSAAYASIKLFAGRSINSRQPESLMENLTIRHFSP